MRLLPTQRTRKRLLFVLFTIAIGGAIWLAYNRVKVRRLAIIAVDVGYALSSSTLKPSFTGADARRDAVALSLTPVLTGLTEPTDLQPVPGTEHQVVVLQKGGQALWADLETGETAPFFSVDVITVSEQGLLGLAFAPDFATSGRFYVDYTQKTGDSETTVIQRLTLVGGWPNGEVQPGPILYQVAQPYQNHNAGQIGFGPDGYLYISMGDGGFANDPHENGQNAQTPLGSILRVDVSGDSLRVPSDNPLLPQQTTPTAVWAYGLRNPWRFSWDPSGRLIVADVGQDKYEEIHLVEAGDNLGWNRMEGSHCFPPDPTESCNKEGLVLPIYDYDHDQGNSITGGYVSRDPRLPALAGRYVFGDFVRGRIWSLTLPNDRTQPVDAVKALGQWPILISSFGQDGAGWLYVVDYGQGRLLRLDPPSPPVQVPL